MIGLVKRGEKQQKQKGDSFIPHSIQSLKFSKKEQEEGRITFHFKRFNENSHDVSFKDRMKGAAFKMVRKHTRRGRGEK